MGREENVKIFQDTQKLCSNIGYLAEGIKHSRKEQKLILEGDQLQDIMPEFAHNKNRYEKKAAVTVSRKRSLEAAEGYRGMKTCVHNFASATTPGGGVVKGSSAQEECLCRCSTLYFCLDIQKMWDGFYQPHRKAENPIHNDDCIYTPGIIVMKTDTAAPSLLPEKEWYKVNILTCAAPNLRLIPANSMNMGDGKIPARVIDRELLAIHEKRWTRILDIALAGGNEAVILGAFGCGAFQNNPEVVALAAKNTIAGYLHSFKAIEFAIYCSPRDEQNYRIFERVMMPSLLES